MNFLKSRKVRAIVAISLVALVVLGSGLAAVFYFDTKESTLTATVCKAESVSTSDTSGEIVNEYRVSVHDGNAFRTYVVKDYVVGRGAPRSNSADFYASLRLDTTYDIVAIGVRSDPASLFPNIVEATRSGEQHPEWCDS